MERKTACDYAFNAYSRQLYDISLAWAIASEYCTGDTPAEYGDAINELRAETRKKLPAGAVVPNACLQCRQLYYSGSDRTDVAFNCEACTPTPRPTTP